MSDRDRTAREYDAMAAEYSADNADNAFNASYERPATIALLGDVKGRRVLEAGCGSGLLTQWLVNNGADVTAFDVSPAMVDIARQGVGDRAGLLVGDLGEPLYFAGDRTFDLVVASLVLHYIADWSPVLSEFARVLAPGGRVVFSTHHPAMDWQLYAKDDYFALRQVTETWSKGSGEFEVTFWRRPLSSMCQSIATAGFVIAELVEPLPSPELAGRDPAAYEVLRTAPRFLFFNLSLP